MNRILHLLLALTVLVSATGVGVYEHLCQMRGDTVSLMVPARTCCAGKSHEVCAAGHSEAFSTVDDSQPSIRKAPCCEDRASWLQADIDGTYLSSAFSAAPAAILWPVLAKAIYPAIPQTASLSLKVVQAMQYKPPSTMMDVRVRVQSFQI